MDRSQIFRRKSLAVLAVAGAATLGLAAHPAGAAPRPAATGGPVDAAETAGSSGGAVEAAAPAAADAATSAAPAATPAGNAAVTDAAKGSATAKATAKAAGKGKGAGQGKGSGKGKGAAGRSGKKPAKRAARVVVLTYNVCGGSCTKQLSIEEWTGRMVGRLESADADVLLLQELCRGQYDQLSRALAGRYESRWAGTMDDNEGCGKQWGGGADSADEQRGFGLAVFVKGAGSIGEHRVWWLPNQEHNEPRALLCVDARLRDRVARVCDTHLDWHHDTQQVQAAFVGRLVNPWAERIPVVLGGDLNAEPGRPSMAHFYDHSGGRGAFQEVDETDKSYFGKVCPKSAERCRTGEGTDGRKKLDYIFLSRRHFTAAEGEAVRDARLSDHDLLRGSAAWRALTPNADFSWAPGVRSEFRSSGRTTATR